MFEREQSACLQRVGAVLPGERGAERVIEILARTGLRAAESGRQAGDGDGRDEVRRVLRKELRNQQSRASSLVVHDDRRRDS